MRIAKILVSVFDHRRVSILANRLEIMRKISTVPSNSTIKLEI